MAEKPVLVRAADNIRILSAAMVEKAKSGHPGGAMGGADFMAVLFSEFLRYDPQNMAWPYRDRFFLDPGHMSPMLYSTLHLAVGSYTADDLKQFRQWGSHTPGHPELDVARGVENTSGPLGMGHAIALGSAIAERFLAARFGEWLAHKTYAFISDGGIQEEVSQGVGRIAGHLGLANLIMFYDSNDIQLSHETSATTSEDTARKYEAWGWRVETIAGNDAEAIRGALTRATRETAKPSLIIGKTVMGLGAVTAEGKNFERQCSTHGQPLSKAGASFEKTVQNLGGDAANPFAVFSEVSAHFGRVRAEKSAAAKKHQDAQAAWGKANAALASKLKGFLSGQLPAVDFAAIQQKPGVATRAASAAVLAVFARQVENMIVSSADLSNSDNTDGFLKNTTAFKRGDFSGRFLQAGVCELTMAAIANGMALHGGVVPVCGTFFVFSDYMKPAVRLAALMGLPVKYVWTHDAFRVGEDGPTHQPVEHEAQIRLLEKMKNLEGRRSILVLRPADAAETTVAWKLALENQHAPTALLLSRQNIPDLPAVAGSTRWQDALAAGRGACTVVQVSGRPDLVLAGNGSEVAILVEAAKRITTEKKLAVRVVSAISEGLFREQPLDYQESVLPFGVPAFGLTAGTSVALAGLVGPLGTVVGLSRFGASAPYQVLDEKFGYTVEAVVGKALAYLDEYRGTLARIAALAR
jgi:transketolase